MSPLRRLVKLSLNGNQLHCLDAFGLERLPNLHFLSVEDNHIASMHGIQRARSLLELYIGNNLIATTRDIFHLKVNHTHIDRSETVERMSKCAIALKIEGRTVRFPSSWLCCQMTPANF